MQHHFLEMLIRLLFITTYNHLQQVYFGRHEGIYLCKAHNKTVYKLKVNFMYQLHSQCCNCRAANQTQTCMELNQLTLLINSKCLVHNMLKDKCLAITDFLATDLFQSSSIYPVKVALGDPLTMPLYTVVTLSLIEQ